MKSDCNLIGYCVVCYSMSNNQTKYWNIEVSEKDRIYVQILKEQAVLEVRGVVPKNVSAVAGKPTTSVVGASHEQYSLDKIKILFRELFYVYDPSPSIHDDGAEPSM